MNPRRGAHGLVETPKHKPDKCRASAKALTVALALASMLVGCAAKDNHKSSRSNPPPKILRSKIGIEFVEIPRGSFLMGNDEMPLCDPVHRVSMSSFYISKSEITNLQYERFKKGRKRGEYSTGDHTPATDMTWHEAMLFCQWLGEQDGRKYSLPTEEQWEYAARGGLEGKDFPWGDGIGQGNCLIGGMKTKPVKSYAPNAFELYDICGNAAEMTRDLLKPYPGAKPDPGAKVTSGPDTGVTRGLGVGASMPWIWARWPSDKSSGDGGTGFRVVILDELGKSTATSSK